MDGPGIAVGPLKLEELSVIIKGLGAAPESLDDLEPFLGVGVAGLVILGQPETERSIFRVVPARDDIEPGTSATDFVNGRNLSGKNEGVCRHRMHGRNDADRSEEHTSELQSLMRISYAVFCFKKK